MPLDQIVAKREHPSIFDDQRVSTSTKGNTDRDKKSNQTIPNVRSPRAQNSNRQSSTGKDIEGLKKDITETKRVADNLQRLLAEKRKRYGNQILKD